MQILLRPRDGVLLRCDYGARRWRLRLRFGGNHRPLRDEPIDVFRSNVELPPDATGRKLAGGDEPPCLPSAERRLGDGDPSFSQSAPEELPFELGDTALEGFEVGHRRDG